MRRSVSRRRWPVNSSSRDWTTRPICPSTRRHCHRDGSTYRRHSVNFQSLHAALRHRFSVRGPRRTRDVARQRPVRGEAVASGSLTVAQMSSAGAGRINVGFVDAGSRLDEVWIDDAQLGPRDPRLCENHVCLPSQVAANMERIVSVDGPALHKRTT